MFTDEELALLDAIHADPKSDTPRLNYADWLDGQGPPYAGEMIRKQLSGDGYPEWLQDYGRPWASPKPKGLIQLLYRRGLPEAHLTSDRNLPELRKMSPRLRYSLCVHDDSTLPIRLAHESAIRVSLLIVYSDFSVDRSPISADAIRRLADWGQIDRIEGIQFHQLLSDEAEAVYQERLANRVTLLGKRLPTEDGHHRAAIIQPSPLARSFRIPRRSRRI